MALPELITNSPTPGVREKLTTLKAELKNETSAKIELETAMPTALHGPGQTRLLIGSEIILVEGTASTTVTVLERGAEGSTKAAHAVGSNVYQILTAEGLKRYTEGLGFEKAVSMAYREGPLKLKSAIVEKIPLDKILKDPGGNISLTNGTYVVPSEGYYQVNGLVSIKISTVFTVVEYLAAIYINGVETILGNRNSTTVSGLTAAATTAGIVFCKKGEEIELRGYQFDSAKGEEREVEVSSPTTYLHVMRVGEGPEGKLGPAGGVSFAYTFSKETAKANPGKGELRLNNATLASVTKIFVSSKDFNGTELNTWINGLGAGKLGVYNSANPANSAYYTIVSIAEESSEWFTITVTYDGVSGGTLETTVGGLVLTYAETGPQGASGSPSWKKPVAYATTEVLNGEPEWSGETVKSKKEEALKVDSASPTVGERILAKNEVEAKHDGIWEVIKAGKAGEKWELKRTADANTTTELQDATTVAEKGTVNEGKSFIQTATVATVGTTAQVWVADGPHTGKGPIAVTGSVIEIEKEKITSEQIKAEGIKEASIEKLAITEAKLGAESVAASKIKAEAVGATKIALEAITPSKIETEAVTETKIAKEAVNTEQIHKESVTAAKLGSSAVVEGKLGAEAVSEAKIKKEAVGTEKIKNLSVTEAKIANEAVTASQLKKEAVTPVKVLPAGTPAATTKENEVTVGTAGIGRKVIAEIQGNNLENRFKVKHSLETKFFIASVLNASFEEPVTMLATVKSISASEVEVIFSVAPGAKVINYVVIVA